MNPPRQKLNVLIVEDSGSDARLMELHLEDAGYEPVSQRVETPEAMSAALERRAWGRWRW